MHALAARYVPNLKRLPALLAAMALAAGALVVLAASVQAAAQPSAPAAPSATVFNVNTTFDTPDQNAGDKLCKDANGHCSLRAAVQQIDVLTTTKNTINLPDSSYVLTDTAGGDLQLQNNVTINGSFFIIGGFPAVTLIAGGPGWNSRILRVQSGAHVALNQLTISKGNLPATKNGGGINVVSGTLTLWDVNVTGNTAGNGGGIYNSGALTLTDSLITSNRAYTEGGGLYNDVVAGVNGFALVTTTLVFSNGASRDGGGAVNTGRLSVLDSTFQANVAADGAGLSNEGAGVLEVDSSGVFSNVTTDGPGAGVENRSPQAHTRLADSTVAWNQAVYNGAGVADTQGTLALYNVTVAVNTKVGASGAGGGIYAGTSQTFTINNTLVALNVDDSGGAPDCYGTFQSKGYNLIQSVPHCTLAGITTGNITGTNPLLAPFGYYGGATLLFGLAPNSPAVDGGDPLGCKLDFGPIRQDQRGLPRKVDGNGDGLAICDIGAYELQPQWLYLPAIAK